VNKAVLRHALRGGFALSVIAAMTGCGTPPPEDFGGHWAPLNRYQEAPAEIPLSPPYLFYAAPIDETLKTMLERWARDAGLKLSYRLGSDFTLYKPVARIRAADIQAAASELSAIYAAQGVSVTADDKQVLVQSTRDIRPAPAPDAPTAVPSPAAR
jgi:hypothetical protein